MKQMYFGRQSFCRRHWLCKGGREVRLVFVGCKWRILCIGDHLDYRNDTRFRRIEQAAESYDENGKVAALEEVADMFHKLYESPKVDSTLKREMMKVVWHIRNGQILLNDPIQHFVKKGMETTIALTKMNYIQREEYTLIVMIMAKFTLTDTKVRWNESVIGTCKYISCGDEGFDEMPSFGSRNHLILFTSYF